MEWWGWVATILGGFVLISNGVNAIKNIFSPAVKMSNKIESVEKKCDDNAEVLETINKRLEEQESTNQKIMQTLLAMLNHEIDGNGIDGMRKVRDTLLKDVKI